jgi:uncharacterized membrane protein
MSAAKILLAIAVIVAYASLSHAALAANDACSIWRQLALLVLLASLIGLLCWGASAALEQVGIGMVARRLGTILLGALMACAGVVFWPALLTRLDWIYLLEHAAANGMLCWFFAHTLFGGRTPIITTLARAIHTELPDKVERYTRKVTIAWAIFFAMQIAVSLVIFNVGSIEAWSFFANVLNWPLVMLMFVVEYAFRRRVDPAFQHATIRQSVAAYFNNKSKI